MIRYDSTNLVGDTNIVVMHCGKSPVQKAIEIIEQRLDNDGSELSAAVYDDLVEVLKLLRQVTS